MRSTLYRSWSSSSIPNSSCLVVRKGKPRQRIGYLALKIPATSGSDHHKLLAAVLAQVGDWRSMRACFQLGGPQLLSGFCIERTKATIHCCADKNQSAGGDNRAAQVRGPGFLLQTTQAAKRHLPDDLSLVHVHGVQRSPRGLLTRPLVLIPEPCVFSVFGTSPVFFWRAIRLR